MILALETSGDTSSVALAADEGLLAEVSFPSKQQLSQTLMGRIDEALQQGGVALEDVGVFAVSLGPGSFTSLRIGVATAKCLAHALGRAVAGVPTHEVIAHQAEPSLGQLVLVATRARAEEVYATLLRARDDGGFDEVSQCEVLSSGQAAEKAVEAAGASPEQVLVCGDAAQMCAESARPEARLTVADADPVPKARHVAHLAALRMKHRGPDDLFSLKPLYARPSQAEAKLEVDLGL